MSCASRRSVSCRSLATRASSACISSATCLGSCARTRTVRSCALGWVDKGDVHTAQVYARQWEQVRPIHVAAEAGRRPNSARLYELPLQRRLLVRFGLLRQLRFFPSGHQLGLLISRDGLFMVLLFLYGTRLRAALLRLTEWGCALLESLQRATTFTSDRTWYQWPAAKQASELAQAVLHA